MIPKPYHSTTRQRRVQVNNQQKYKFKILCFVDRDRRAAAQAWTIGAGIFSGILYPGKFVRLSSRVRDSVTSIWIANKQTHRKCCKSPQNHEYVLTRGAKGDHERGEWTSPSCSERWEIPLYKFSDRSCTVAPIHDS